MMRRWLISCILALSLTGCSLTTPRDTGNARRVFLPPLPAKSVCNAKLHDSLTLAYPEVPDALDTARIALIDNNGRWDYFAGTRWSDFLGSGIQAALISSFSGSGNFSAIYSDDAVSEGRLKLSSQVRMFQAVYKMGAQAPEAQIEIMFTLRETARSDIRKQFTARSQVEAQANTADAIDRAFEQAFTEIQTIAMRKILSCRSE